MLIVLYEGGIAKPFTTPLTVVRAFCKELSSIRRGTVEKRKLAERVLSTAIEDAVNAGDDGLARILRRYFPLGMFDWERFFGSRDDYYNFFRAPLLLFEHFGVVDSGRSRYALVDWQCKSYMLRRLCNC